MQKFLFVTVLAVAIVAVACGGGSEAPAPEASAPEAAAPAAGSATVSGTVTYANGDPDAEINMDADPVCSGLHDEAVHTQQVVKDEAGNLANVFVYVKSGLTGSYDPPAEAALLDQKGCQYHPHVSGVQVGQKIVIRNSDPTLHNVHALPEKNAEFNQGQPFEGMELEKTFDQEEVMVRFKCDVHPWMSSYMGVLKHPFFAITGEDGSFSIEGLPAGTYTLEAWHETLGTQTLDVTVEDGGAADATFAFAPAA